MGQNAYRLIRFRTRAGAVSWRATLFFPVAMAGFVAVSLQFIMTRPGDDEDANSTVHGETPLASAQMGEGRRVGGATPSSTQTSLSPGTSRTIVPKQGDEGGTASTIPSEALLDDRLSGLLDGLQPDVKATAEAIRRFVASGKMAEVRALNRDAVEAMARELTEPRYGKGIMPYLQAWPRVFPLDAFSNDSPTEAMMEVFDAISDQGNSSSLPSVLVVTDGCAPDGTVTGTIRVLPPGTLRVYAVFENARSLRRLSHVFTVWRNLGDDRMVFAQTEPIRRGSRYNYVWLQIDGGWPGGRYQVDLFDPEHPSQLLASEGFRIKQL